ncbi:MAG: hypothetical protein GY950_17105 [bacterium]|nr:hypothetical protein [bacterium]
MKKSFDKEDKPRTVRITLRDLEQTDPGQSPEENCSFGTFVQLFTEKGPGGKDKLMGAVNSTFPGFGKMFSRFLHILDPVVTDDMRTWNKSLIKEDQFFLEDSDASFFNANLHPPLMPHEIHMPNSQNSLPPENQVPITELQVKVAETGGSLQLIHTPTKKKVHVFDLGFQGHKGRSQLFQLLEKFTRARYLHSYYLVNGVNGFYTPKPAEPGQQDKKDKEGEPEEIKRTIQTIPRILYEDRLVLQRQSWMVPEELLPVRTPEESDWAWFCRVNQWRLRQGIPEEVFIFVVDRMASMQNRPQKQQKPAKRTSPDDYKPQYISFKNPFLLNLFEKAIKRVPDTLKIVEMLPGSQQLPNIDTNRYIMEFVLQWYTQEK